MTLVSHPPKKCGSIWISTSYSFWLLSACHSPWFKLTSGLSLGWFIRLLPNQMCGNQLADPISLTELFHLSLSVQVPLGLQMLSLILLESLRVRSDLLKSLYIWEVLKLLHFSYMWIHLHSLRNESVEKAKRIISEVRSTWVLVLNFWPWPSNWTPWSWVFPPLK